MRAEDNGHEEEYQHTIGHLMEQAFAAAFLFYLNEQPVQLLEVFKVCL